MQLGLVALAMVFLGSMGHGDVLKLSKARRQRRISTEGPPSCPKGCDRCSEYNGCVKCKPKLFIFLERNDIRQIGVCLASCPVGYFGMRNPETNRCTRQPAVECELGEWSQWGPCMKKNKTCGFKRGSQSRVREPLQQVSGLDSSVAPVTSEPPCAPQTERRKCSVLKTPCTRGKKNKGDRKDEPSKKEKESGRGRGKEGKEGSKDGGGGGKKRKGQGRTSTTTAAATVLSITTTSVT
ncbi:R-spondin-1 isoform X2 [Lampris incognitus]|uniref:R-spondin-1 isoform X2 n=1 Tax=Lampris incognitus TaxID=2546036 RepID=UPI0024B63372|nr:R-spondin-1 isoform X2 [Lampris incognitus]